MHVIRLVYAVLTACLFGAACGVLAVVIHGVCVATGLVRYPPHVKPLNGEVLCLILCAPLGALMHFGCRARAWSRA
jgi:hypothetical protein